MTTSHPCQCWARAILLSVLGLLAAGSVGLAQPEKSKPDPLLLAKVIDAAIQKPLDAKKVPVSPRTDDAEFLRRVYLDIAGVIPTAEKAAAFLDSRAPDKRSQLVQQLLTSPEHARQMADLWLELLIPKTAEAVRRDQLPMVRWLNQSFAENKPWDRLFADILTANGYQDENPATTFFVVHESVDQLVDTVTRALLGVHLQCAQCHDHPFTDWKRDEYWAFAGLFNKVGRLCTTTDRGRERYGASENVKQPARLVQPYSARKLPAKFPRGALAELDPEKPHMPVLARWLTAPDNPYFARAMVNRLWAHFFGRGLVNPVDRLDANNPATHPQLLDELARQFVAAGFDARFLMRAICLSETYQRSSRPLEGNKTDQQLYSHALVRVLLSFQLCDSCDRVWSAGATKPPTTAVDATAENWLRGHRTGFASFFAAEPGSRPTEYRAGIPQALRLMNGKDTTRVYHVVVKVLNVAKTKPEVITQLYLITLSRRPRPEEADSMLRFIEKHGNQPETYQDILWALLNSTEFVTNH